MQKLEEPDGGGSFRWRKLSQVGDDAMGGTDLLGKLPRCIHVFFNFIAYLQFVAYWALICTVIVLC